MEALTGVLVQGLILSIMTLGVYMSYKILDFPDMTADGSFTLGGAIIAIALKSGVPPMMGSVLAFMAGLAAGFITGWLHVKVKISNLLSGILVMGILYTVNLRIMGRANIPIFSEANVFMKFNPLIFALITVALFKISLDRFLQTGLGYTLKGVGDNPQMMTSLGVEIGRIKILGLMLSNGLVAFSGSIMAQSLGFSDMSMGIGTLVLGIASIIIGTSILNKGGHVKDTTLVIAGTLIYQVTVYFAMNMGLTAVDLKMITSLVIIVFLGASGLKNSENTKIFGGMSSVKNSKLVKKLS